MPHKRSVPGSLPGALTHLTADILGIHALACSHVCHFLSDHARLCIVHLRGVGVGGAAIDPGAAELGQASPRIQPLRDERGREASTKYQMNMIDLMARTYVKKQA